jgi:hypothetical protein
MIDTQMIWQLLKRDPAMKTTPMVAVLLALAAAGLTFLPEPGRAAMGRAIPACLIGPVSLFLVLQSQRGLYEAALPIDTRDLWLSRVLSLLAMIWVPSCVVLAIGLPRLPLFEAGAVCTVIVLAVKRVGIRELTVPPWLGRIAQAFFVCLFLMPFVLRPLKSVHWPALPSPGSVLAICLPAGAALFWWGWTSVPKSFQIAPMEEAGSMPVLSRETNGPSEFAWPPVLRVVCGGQPMLLMIGFVFASVTFGHGTAGVLAAIPQNQIRARYRWLLALPFSPRKLFGLIAIPAAAATVLGSIAHIFIDAKHPLAPRARFVELLAQLAAVYFVIFLSELPSWSRLSKLWAWARWIPFGLAFVAEPLVFNDIGVFPRLAAALPPSGWQLAAALAFPLIASYWLAEKAFVEREYRQTYLETKNISRV